MNIKYLNKDCEKIAKSCDLEFGKVQQQIAGPGALLLTDTMQERGFEIFALSGYDTFLGLEQIITDQIRQRLARYQAVPDDFDLRSYHKYLTNSDNHFKVSTWALDYRLFGKRFFEVRDQVEQLLHRSLKVKKISHAGVEGEYVGFRVLRPGQNDHNPFHRDSWIPYWQDTVNIWLPICGFENANSIQLIPGSHRWSDDQILKTKSGVEIEGKKYHVPAAIGTVNNFSVETPLMKKGDALIFSPYLIHGNGENKLTDTTRVSLEFRFCAA
jgi:hypothetical protein